MKSGEIWSGRFRGGQWGRGGAHNMQRVHIRLPVAACPKYLPKSTGTDISLARCPQYFCTIPVSEYQLGVRASCVPLSLRRERISTPRIWYVPYTGSHAWNERVLVRYTFFPFWYLYVSKSVRVFFGVVALTCPCMTRCADASCTCDFAAR